MNTEKNYTVYMHVSPSGKRYIGITKQKPIVRWKGGKGYKCNPYFTKAINKYGWSNFQHIILYIGLTKSEAEQKEISLIKEYKTTDKAYGYNIENGGNCCGTHSQETRAKIGAKSKGNKACAGRKISKEHIQALYEGRLRQGYSRPPLSEEAKAKISVALTGKKHSPEHIQHVIESHPSMKGENNPMFGKHHSAETRAKIAEKHRGKKAADEVRKILSERAFKRAVIQITLNGVEVNRYSSIADAAKAVNAKSTNIVSVCRGKQKSCRGFIWRYADDDS